MIAALIFTYVVCFVVNTILVGVLAPEYHDDDFQRWAVAFMMFGPLADLWYIGKFLLWVLTTPYYFWSKK